MHMGTTISMVTHIFRRFGPRSTSECLIPQVELDSPLAAGDRAGDAGDLALVPDKKKPRFGALKRDVSLIG